MLLTKEVEIKLWGKSIKHYNDLGYKGKHGDVIVVNIQDLLSNSKADVKVECDYCNKCFHTQYSSYIKSIKYINKNTCNDGICKAKKIKETNLLRYGVDNVAKMQSVQEKMLATNIKKYGSSYYMQTTEFREKSKKTMIEKYGVNIPLKNKEILEKTHQTNMERYGVATPMESDKLKQRYEQNCIEKYGVKYPIQLDTIKEKIKQTCLEKYGVSAPAKCEEVKEKYRQTCLNKYGVDSILKVPEILEKKNKTMIEKYGTIVPLKNQSILNKSKQTNIEKYGVDNPSKSPEIKEKITKTLYKNSSQQVSRQQFYLHNLFGGELNYPISYYNADVCLTEEKIDIEYDGGGHDLSVKLGNMTQEEFDQKEIIRNYVVKREGYKRIRIISSKDYLPSDEILLQMLEQAKEYFNTTNHTWVEYNIDSSIMRNAEHKEGVFFDFGELRKIKKIS